MQQYNGDITTFQQQYSSDLQALNNAKTATAYAAVLAKLNAHVQAIKIPAMKAQGQSLQYQLQQEVASWGSSTSTMIVLTIKTTHLALSTDQPASEIGYNKS